MNNDGAFHFSKEHKEAYEMLPTPLGIYQLIDCKVVTLLVSDGLCDLMGKERSLLMDHFNNDMFGNVHPDDAEMLARLGYRFATKRDSYDIIYRTRLYGRNEYRYVHAVGQFRQMDDDTFLAFLEYTDITDSEQQLIQTLQEFDSPKARFFDENMGAMVVVSSEKKQLLYFNKAVCRMLSPKVNYDSGMTFQQYFYSCLPDAMNGLFDRVDMGPKVITEPYTHRDLEVNTISSTWNDEPAYVVYFYERLASSQVVNQDNALRHKRMAFNSLIFSGSKNELASYQNGYKGYRVWNLTRNEMILNEGSAFIDGDENTGKTFDHYMNTLYRMSATKENDYFFNICTKDQLILRYESRAYPQNQTIPIQTKAGRIFISLEITLMKSPDTGEIYIKVSEENVTDERVVDTLMMQTIKNQYDYIAYLDLLANKTRIVFGTSTPENRKNTAVKPVDYIKSASGSRQLEIYFRHTFSSLDDLVAYIDDRCGGESSFFQVCELPNGRFKKIFIQIIDRSNQIYYLQCSDITDILQTERKREKELKEANYKVQMANKDLHEAVRAEHEKVESILLQTILSVNNALDARDEYTCRHSERVSEYSAEVARRLGWTAKKVANLYNIALVHDIGKIGIPDALLLKPAALTESEYEQLKKHVEIGGVILKDFTAIDKVSEGALYHHERYDGSGYTRGLSGEAIPIEARIIGVADAVDAMNSTRPYRERQSKRYIIDELNNGRGTQFDPLLVDIMLEMINDGLLDLSDLL